MTGERSCAWLLCLVLVLGALGLGGCAKPDQGSGEASGGAEPGTTTPVE